MLQEVKQLKQIEFTDQNSYRTAVETVPANERTIFVSIPSYRDPECGNTIQSMFVNAEFPERVYAGICQQNRPGDPDCTANKLVLDEKVGQNIQVCRIGAHEAKGPSYARAIIERLHYNNQHYYMLVDSHTRFAPGWDSACIQQLHECASPKPVLTCYPPEYARVASVNDIAPQPCFLKFYRFSKLVQVPQGMRQDFARPPTRCYRSLFWASGFSFGFGLQAYEVPYDIHCPYLFVGEESAMAVRLFTSGYDFYSPRTVLVQHLSEKAYRPQFFENFYTKFQTQAYPVPEHLLMQRKHQEAQSVVRVQQVLNGGNYKQPYALGTVRTLGEYYAYTGINYTLKAVTRRTELGLSRDCSDIELLEKFGDTDIKDGSEAEHKSV